MKTFLFIITCLLTPLTLFAQIDPNFNCDDFILYLESNTRNHIEFLNKQRYFEQIDSIQKNKIPAIIENKILNDEFQKKFPNTITAHCIHANSFSEGKIEKTSFCNETYKIFLIAKEYNFYIFKFLAFEIDDYLIFNTNDKTFFFANNYPTILNNGKLIIDIGYSYGGFNTFKYFKFKSNNDIDYFELSIPAYYQIKSHQIIKTPNSFKLQAELVKYNLKETSPNKYDYDETDYCSKFINIPVYND